MPIITDFWISWICKKWWLLSCMAKSGSEKRASRMKSWAWERSLMTHPMLSLLPAEGKTGRAWRGHDTWHRRRAPRNLELLVWTTLTHKGLWAHALFLLFLLAPLLKVQSRCHVFGQRCSLLTLSLLMNLEQRKFNKVSSLGGQSKGNWEKHSTPWDSQTLFRKLWSVLSLGF